LPGDTTGGFLALDEVVILRPVSAEKVEIARAMRDALVTGGPDAAEDFFHPDVTFEVAVGQFEGIEGMSTWFQEIAKYLIDYEIVEAPLHRGRRCRGRQQRDEGARRSNVAGDAGPDLPAPLPGLEGDPGLPARHRG
jgi:SnoaL-like domain